MKLLLVTVLLTCSLLSSTLHAKENSWTDLFNGKNLEGWKVLAGDGKFSDDNSLIANEIFVVKEGSIHVYPNAEQGTKQERAILLSDKKYSKFHLKITYRWLDNRFQPRSSVNRDSGILIHAHTWLAGPWPPSVEMQMGDGRVGEDYVTGDLWVLGNTRVKTPQLNDAYTANATRVVKSGEHGAISNLTSIDAENGAGEWNTAEVIVDGNRSAKFILNGKLVNEVFDMEMKNKENGQWLPLDEGHIVLQAEWAELEFKSISIK